MGSLYTYALISALCFDGGFVNKCFFIRAVSQIALSSRQTWNYSSLACSLSTDSSHL